jgi:hypothetical protein
MKQKMIIGFIIIGVLSLIIGVCMHFDILNAKPLFVKWYAVIIIAGGSILLGYITLTYDKNSSKKTDDILENTKTAGSGIIDLNKKAKSIYDLNKAIKFSMPNKIAVTYSVFFQLGEQFQKKADSIINSHYQFDNPGAYSGVKYDLLKTLFDWNNYVSDWITVSFAKDYMVSKTEVTYNSLLLSFTNFESLRNSNNSQGVKKLLLYNPTERKFLIQIEDVQLVKQISSNLSLNPNLINSSIFDLAKSTMVLIQSFPNRFKSIEIFHLKISSPELNLLFWKLKNTENSDVFIDDVKFDEGVK